jgi:hypothetical protein
MSEPLYFNGVNATRGAYARDPLTAQELAARIRGDQPDPARLDPDAAQREALRARFEQRQAGQFGVMEGVDEKDLAQTGWGVIFPADPAYAPVREALQELLAWRQAQAGARYRECAGANGYHPGERKADFLRRQGAATSGPVDPDRFPYYLLLVGDPERIPFRFQYQLDVQYAVGRLYFDTLDAYAAYARSVVIAEGGTVQLARRAVFFGVQSPDDPATQLSTRELVEPLTRELRENRRVAGWQIDSVPGPEARKARLTQLLGGADTPALLFTASHGLEFDAIDPRQVRDQGALLCSDWPGPRAWSYRAIPPEFYFGGDDVPADANLLGTMAFHFACFGAGTPRLDDFPHERGFQAAIAPHAFVANLPQRLLGHPRGGALAVIGHVERAWTFSFNDAQGARQIETFSSALRRLMIGGAPVGFALEFFNDRYAELAAGLTEDLENARFGQHIDDLTLAIKWTEHNDARSYVVLGDPAVRLPLAAEGAAPTNRATIPEVHATVTAPEPVPQPTPAAPPAPAPAPGPHMPPSTPPSTTWQAAPGYPPAVVVYYGYPPPGQPGAPGAPPVGSGGASFGLFGNNGKIAEAAQKLTESLQEFADQIGNTLKQVLEDAAHLDVETYVADDLSSVNYAQNDFQAATLRAVTRMKLDGDTKVLVPMSEGQLDERLWAIHTSMVAQAQANRAEMIRAISSAAAGLLGAVQGK